MLWRSYELKNYKLFTVCAFQFENLAGFEIFFLAESYMHPVTWFDIKWLSK